MFVDPTNPGLRLVYFLPWATQKLKCREVHFIPALCTFSIKKKSKKREKKKKEFLVEIVQFVGVLGLQPLLVFT